MLRRWVVKRREQALSDYLALNGQRFESSPRIVTLRPIEPVDPWHGRRIFGRELSRARRRLARADRLLDIITLNGRITS